MSSRLLPGIIAGVVLLLSDSIRGFLTYDCNSSAMAERPRKPTKTLGAMSLKTGRMFPTFEPVCQELFQDPSRCTRDERPRSTVFADGRRGSETAL